MNGFLVLIRALLDWDQALGLSIGCCSIPMMIYSSLWKTDYNHLERRQLLLSLILIAQLPFPFQIAKICINRRKTTRYLSEAQRT